MHHHDAAALVIFRYEIRLLLFSLLPVFPCFQFCIMVTSPSYHYLAWRMPVSLNSKVLQKRSENYLTYSFIVLIVEQKYPPNLTIIEFYLMLPEYVCLKTYLFRNWNQI